jgi:hypothetical protein
MSLFKNKKGIELSINFVVMLIIALVVFGMGIVLFTKFFQEAENIRDNLDDQTRNELEAQMMSSSEKMVVYPTSLTIRKGKADVVGVGILNVGDSEEFTVLSEYKTCYDRDGNDLDTACLVDGDDPLGLLKDSSGDPLAREVNIPQNKREIASVPIKVLSGAASAKYSVLITVEQIDPSGNIKIGKNLVYINVP